MSDQVVENVVIPQGQKLTVWTLGAFYPGLSTNSRHPIVLARRLVAASPRSLALKPKGIDVVATAEKGPEQGDLLVARQGGWSQHDASIFGHCGLLLRQRRNPLDDGRAFSVESLQATVQSVQVLRQRR
jgi:hypothetical protein